jgi:KDO2-lipid IV(A) lauroyltransferase
MPVAIETCHQRNEGPNLSVKAVATQPVQPSRAAAAAHDRVRGEAVVDAGVSPRPPAAFWLERLFWLAEHVPAVLRLTAGVLARGAFRGSASIRAGTLANAGRILGSDSPAAARRRLARGVVEHFILFCHDVGRSLRMTPDELYDQIEHLEGHDHYAAARALRKGAIVVTAHMGSFEVGMAALRRQDARVHVVFRRDAIGRFERMRAALRAKLGVIETPVDEGWTVWMRLRDALLADEVVVLQGDRVMPGQKGQSVPVLGADMLLPAGPAKLALATGAPIVPVFSVRTPGGRVRLCVEPPIVVDGRDPAAGVDRAMNRMAAVIAKYVAAHPEQWLMLHPAWCADASADARAGAA